MVVGQPILPFGTGGQPLQSNRCMAFARFPDVHTSWPENSSSRRCRRRHEVVPPGSKSSPRRQNFGPDNTPLPDFPSFPARRPHGVGPLRKFDQSLRSDSRIARKRTDKHDEPGESLNVVNLFLHRCQHVSRLGMAKKCWRKRRLQPRQPCAQDATVPAFPNAQGGAWHARR